MNMADDHSEAPDTYGQLEVLLIIDPIAELQPGHDSSVAIMEAAQARGHRVSVTTIPSLAVDGRLPIARCTPIAVEPAVLENGMWVTVDDWYRLGPSVQRDLNEFDIVMMRSDPPVDDAYLRATFILDFVDPAATLVVNSPSGLRNANEKLFGMRVPAVGPATLLSADPEFIVERVRTWGKAVLKPTNGMAGRGVLVLDPNDVNLRSILEATTERGRRQVVVQQWIDGAIDGDRRIILVDGTPVGSVRRVALGDDFRCNMAAGAATVQDGVDAADRALCEALAPHLKQHGLAFVGIDVIGGQLTEVNVTSPTGIREIDALSGTDVAGDLMEWAQRVCAARMEMNA